LQITVCCEAQLGVPDTHCCAAQLGVPGTHTLLRQLPVVESQTCSGPQSVSSTCEVPVAAHKYKLLSVQNFCPALQI
jgi:hypothetical protein